MRNLKVPFLVLALFVLAGGQNIFAQNSLRREVIKKLNELKPPNEKNYIYKIAVPTKPQMPPENLRLDIVYKIGHYEYKCIALRFEKEKNADFVNVTRFAYGSALGFYKKYSKYSESDAYIAEHGKLTAAEFNKLLSFAYLLYQSNIEREFVAPKAVKRRSRAMLTSGVGNAVSMTSSLGDGSIILNLLDAKNDFRPVIKESGTLHAGYLKKRLSNGYEDLRTHVFWEIFHNYFEKNNIFAALDKTRAGEIALSRLAEPPIINSYEDYYRQSLYVEILGEFGTIKALPILKKLSEGNSLEENWNKHLKKDAAKAIEKITGREESGG